MTLSDGTVIRLKITKDRLQREYWLNGKHTTVKNLRFHLAKLGINMHSDNPSFLIQQNQIVQLPQKKPKYLAELICDASGSLAFDEKVREASRKLENWELTKKTLQEHMKTIELQFNEWNKQEKLLKQKKSLDTFLQNLERQILSHHHQQTQHKLNKAKMQVEDEKREIHRLKQLIQTSREEYLDLSIEADELKQSLEDETTHSMRSNLSETRVQQARLNQQASLLTKKIEESQKALEQLDGQQKETDRELNNQAKLKAMSSWTHQRNLPSGTKKSSQQLQSEIQSNKQQLQRHLHRVSSLQEELVKCDESLLSIEQKLHSHWSTEYQSFEQRVLESKLLETNASLISTNASIQRYELNQKPSYQRSKFRISNARLAIEIFYWKAEASTHLKALGQVLKGKLASLVVENSSQMENLIENLKTHSRNVSIYSLDRIRYRELERRQRQFSASVRASNIEVTVALDLVQYKPEYHSLMLKLFGEVALCESDSDAHSLAQSIPFGVVLSNHTSNVHYAGGSSIRSANLHGKEFSILRESYNYQRDKLQLDQLRREKENKEHLIHHIKQYLDTDEKRQSIERQLGEVQKQMDELESTSAILQLEWQALQQEHTNDEHLESVEWYTQKIASLKARKEQQKCDLTQTRKDIRKLRMELMNVDEQKKQYLQKEASLKHTLHSELETHESKKHSLREIEQKMEELRERNENWKSDLSSRHQSLDQRRGEMQSLQALAEEQQIRLNAQVSHDEGSTNPNETSHESYETTLQQLEKEHTVVQLKIDDIQKEIQNLRVNSNLENLVASWENIQKKFSLLQEENNSLAQFLKKSQDQVRQINLKCFHSIAQLFSKYVSQLVPGKEARLGLVSSSDIAAGVRIQVTDEGEECHLSQLSGGQKSLLAAGLIFAIGAQHSSQRFFLLDEVDAALDENNQTRLSQFLTQFSSSGQQLIYVSHHSNSQKVAQKSISVEMDPHGHHSIVKQGK